MEENSSTIANNASNAIEADSLAQKTNAMAVEGGDVMKEAIGRNNFV